MKTTAAVWAERVRAWRASGLSATDFARPEAYRGKTLSWWASELKRRERVQASAAPKVAMARVRVVRRTQERDEAISIVVAGAHVTLRRGLDAALLREIVAALGATR
jgi:hypothetical protein